MSRRRGLLTAALCALSALAALAGCGTTEPPGDRIAGHNLTVYASLPLIGADHERALEVADGAELALRQVGGRVGRLHVTLRVLDDATPTGPTWDPGQTAQDAREASSDPRTIAYLGDLDSGASAVSIPIVGRAGIVQVSPGSSAVGLTDNGPGAQPGEPQKYYPTGIRTFARVVPDDVAQAQALVDAERGANCGSTYVLETDGFDSYAAGGTFSAVAQQAGLRVQGVQSYDPRATVYGPVAVAVGNSGADCVVVSASLGDHALALIEQLAAALPGLKLFGTSDLAQSGFVNPARGGLPLRFDSRLQFVSPVLPPQALAAGPRQLLSQLTRSGAPPAQGMFGYAAMDLLLEAIDRATHGGRDSARRSSVRAAVFATRNSDSILGTFSITRSGDTTLRRYGIYRVLGGHLSFSRAVGPAGQLAESAAAQAR